MENNRDPLSDIEQQRQTKTTETKRTVGTSTRALEGNFRPTEKKRPVNFAKNNYCYQLGRVCAKRGIEDPDFDPEASDAEAADFWRGYTDTIDAMGKAVVAAKDKKSSKWTWIGIGIGVGGFTLMVIWIDGKGRGGK